MARQTAYLATNRDDLIRLAAFIRSMPRGAKVYFLADVFAVHRLLRAPWWLRCLLTVGQWWSRMPEITIWMALLKETKTGMVEASIDGLIDHMLNGRETGVIGGFTQFEIDTLARSCFLIDYKFSKGFLK